MSSGLSCSETTMSTHDNLPSPEIGQSGSSPPCVPRERVPDPGNTPHASVPALKLVRETLHKSNGQVRRDTKGVNFHSIADLISPTENKENQSDQAKCQPVFPYIRHGGPVPAANMYSPVRSLTPLCSNMAAPITSSNMAAPLTSTPDPCRSMQREQTPSPNGLNLSGEDFPLLSPVAEVHPRGVGLGGCQGKKGRTIYRTQQVSRLEQVFATSQYPDIDVVEALAAELAISETKIKVWFQNKRARLRRRLAAQGHKPRSSSPQDQGVPSVSPPSLPHSMPAFQVPAGPQPALPRALPQQPPVWQQGPFVGADPGVFLMGMNAAMMPQVSNNCRVPRPNLPPMPAQLPVPPHVFSNQAGLPPTCAFPYQLPPVTMGTTMHPSPLATLSNLPQGIGQA